MNILTSIGHWIFNNKRLSLIALLLVLYFCQIAYTNHLAGELNKIKLNAEKDKAQAVIDAIAKIKPIEIKYTEDKVIHDEKTIEVIKYVPQILKEPYYINRECFNNEFVGLYNSYVNTDTAKPVSALQESAKLN